MVKKKLYEVKKIQFNLETIFKIKRINLLHNYICLFENINLTCSMRKMSQK